MDRLRSLHAVVRGKGKYHAGTLPDSGMALTIESPTPFAMYRLDDDAVWGEGEKPDGVLIAEDAVCFIELKGSYDEHGLDQMVAAVEHFHPEEPGRGRLHHDLWAQGRDLPQAFKNRQVKSVCPAPDHQVFEILVVRRAGTRHPPTSRNLGTKTVTTVVMQRHEDRGMICSGLSELLSELRK